MGQKRNIFLSNMNNRAMHYEVQCTNFVLCCAPQKPFGSFNAFQLLITWLRLYFATQQRDALLHPIQKKRQ